jgi:hypothetical protein
VSFRVRSLSIFSFEYLKAWIRLSYFERANWIGIPVILGLTAVLCDAFRSAYSNKPLSPTFRTLAVAELARRQPEFIFVGSSHIYTAVDPSQFNRPVANLSDSGLNYQCAEVLCKHFQLRIRGATSVIIELDAVPVYQDTILLRKGDFRDFWEWGLTGWQLPVNGWTKLSAEINRRLGITRCPPLTPREFLVANVPEKVIGPGFKGRLDQLRPELKDAFFSELGTEFPQEVVLRNLMALHRIVDNLNKQGVKIFMLRMPFHQDYWRHPTSEKREQYATMALEHLRNHCSSPVPEIIDLRNMRALKDAHFSDWTHLSASGAVLLSQELDRILKSRLSDGTTSMALE